MRKLKEKYPNIKQKYLKRQHKKLKDKLEKKYSDKFKSETQEMERFYSKQALKIDIESVKEELKCPITMQLI